MKNSKIDLLPISDKQNDTDSKLPQVQLSEEKINMIKLKCLGKGFI